VFNGTFMAFVGGDNDHWTILYSKTKELFAGVGWRCSYTAQFLAPDWSGESWSVNPLGRGGVRRFTTSMIMPHLLCKGRCNRCCQCLVPWTLSSSLSTLAGRHFQPGLPPIQHSP
jgi:hypothetical protein